MTITEPTLRRPGWVLIATTKGPHCWHQVDQATEFGGVRAVCGMRGRVIREEQRQIMPCPVCAEATGR